MTHTLNPEDLHRLHAAARGERQPVATRREPETPARWGVSGGDVLNFLRGALTTASIAGTISVFLPQDRLEAQDILQPFRNMGSDAKVGDVASVIEEFFVGDSARNLDANAYHNVIAQTAPGTDARVSGLMGLWDPRGTGRESVIHYRQPAAQWIQAHMPGGMAGAVIAASVLGGVGMAWLERKHNQERGGEEDTRDVATARPVRGSHSARLNVPEAALPHTR